MKRRIKKIERREERRDKENVIKKKKKNYLENGTMTIK